MITAMKKFFSVKNHGTEGLDGCVLPAVVLGDLLSCRFRLETVPDPNYTSWQLEAEQIHELTFTDQEAVLSDFDFTYVDDSLQWGEHGNFKFDPRQFRRRERLRTSGRPTAAANSALGNAAIERTGRINVPDAASQIDSMVYGNETSMWLRQHA